MVKARTWLALVIVSVGTVAATASCGSDEATGGGSGGGLITAGSGGTGGRTAVGRGGSSGGGGAASTGISALGQTCTADTDCDAGMSCLLPNSTSLSVGGPAQGMCTATCTVDADCAPFEAGAGCVQFSATNFYCLESCVPGNPTDPTTKCQGRPDFICADLSPTSVPQPFCVPHCAADAECGAGLFCDNGIGECVKTKPTGDPVGTACDPTAMNPTCEGLCLSISQAKPTVGVCAEFCAGLTDCLYTGTTPGGVCFGLQSGSGYLDPGFCEPSCTCDSDCSVFPGQVCQAWTSDASGQSYETDLGKPGFCFPNATGSVELSCGEGGAPSGPSGAAGVAGAN